MEEAPIFAPFAKNNMFFFYYGENDFLAREEIGRQIKKYSVQEKITYDAGSDSDVFDNFKEDIFQNSIFGVKKIVIVNNPFLCDELISFAKKNIEKLIKSENLAIFWQRGKINKEKPFLEKLKRKKIAKEFTNISQNSLFNWVAERANIYNLKISSDAIKKIIDFCGNDLWKIDNELKKLGSYKPGEAIKKEDVLVMVEPTREINVFDILEAVSKKDKKTAIILLKRYLHLGKSPFYVLSMLSYQYRAAIIIKSATEIGLPFQAIIQKTGIHRHVVWTIFNNKNINLKEAKMFYKKILFIEKKIKTGSILPEPGLFLLLS